MEKLYTVNEVAEYFRVSPRTVRDWIATRRISFMKIGGSIRVSQSVIDTMLRDSAVDALR